MAFAAVPTPAMTADHPPMPVMIGPMPAIANPALPALSAMSPRPPAIGPRLAVPLAMVSNQFWNLFVSWVVLSVAVTWTPPSCAVFSRAASIAALKNACFFSASVSSFDRLAELSGVCFVRLPDLDGQPEVVENHRARAASQRRSIRSSSDLVAVMPHRLTERRCGGSHVPQSLAL